VAGGGREWDLAVLAGRADDAGEGRVALAAYASASGHPVPDRARLATFTRARELGAAVWSLGMAHQYPRRYREVAASWLTRMLASPDPAS